MQRFIAFLLSCLLLLSSTGVTYAEHYCGSHKMAGEFTLGHADLNCGMSVPASSCDTPAKAMDCCDNHYLSVDTDDDFAKISFDFEPLPDFALGHTVRFDLTIQSFELHKQVAVIPYRPPPDSTPLFILYETYLI